MEDGSFLGRVRVGHQELSFEHKKLGMKLFI